MKSIKRILATTLMLAMVFTMVMGTFSVSAASDVTCSAALVVVDDDFAGKAKGATVEATVAGIKYIGKMGTTAFATVEEALAAVESQGSIYVAAGVYSGDLVIDKNVSFYGNMKDVSPNKSTDPSIAINGRAATGVNETVLQNTRIYYKPVELGEVVGNNYGVVVNGFAFAGDSCIRLQDNRYSNARITITNNVFDLTNENAYADIGISDDNFSAIFLGLQTAATYIAAEVTVTNNRIEKVGSTGAGIKLTNGIVAFWATRVTVSGNYVANATNDGIRVAQLQTATTITDNYIYNCGKVDVYNNIGGLVEISGNTFDTVGGTTATGQYALGIYATGTATGYTCIWRLDANSVLVHENTFKNVGKAIYIGSRQRTNDTAVNSGPYGTSVYDNVFEPAMLSDCTFIQMKYNDGTYAPKVYDNYTAGLNPKDICVIDPSCAVTSSFDFDSYWLNADKTDSSDLLAVTAITNTAGISFAGANIDIAPDCTISATIPYSLDEITLGLEVIEGGYYELYADKECTTLLENDTLALSGAGVHKAYAKVYYGDYSIVYVLLMTKKEAYTQFLPSNELVVGSEFAQYPSGQVVYVEIADTWYRAQVGNSAYSDLGNAIANAQKGDIIHLMAGVYAGSMSFDKGVTIKGPKAGINPTDMSDPEFGRSAERSNDAEEAIFTSPLTLKAGINGLTFDGIKLSEQAKFQFSGSFQVKGLTFKYLISDTKAADSLIQRGRNDTGAYTQTDFYMGFCRIEKGAASYIMRMPNIATGLFEGNVFYNCNKYIYMGGTDGSASDVMEFRNNVFYKCTASNVIYVGQTTGADGSNSGSRTLNSIKLDGNRFINCTGTYVLRLDRWRSGGNLTVVNNIFEGTTDAGIFANPEPGYGGQTIDMHENYFGSSMKIALTNNLDSIANCSHNYYANGVSSAISGQKVYVPYYIDANMTILAGDYEVESVKSPAGAQLDRDNRTITYTGEKAVDTLKIDMTVSAGASYELYADAAFTTPLTNVITLAGAYTKVYAKVISEDGITYSIYTIELNQPANSAAGLLGLDVEGSSWMNQGNNKFTSTLPNTYVNGTLVPVTSAGATVSLYAGADTEMQNPINYNAPMYFPVGKTPFIVKVTSEDGSTTEIYNLTVNRSKSDACAVLDVADSIEDITVDGTTVTAVFDNATTALTPVLTVSDAATYKLFRDVGCSNLPLKEDVQLSVGENTVYALVTAEDGTSTQIYTIVLVRSDKSTDTRILGAESFPEYAISQAELDADELGVYKGIKIVNNNSGVYLRPSAYIESIQDALAVCAGATYEIFKDFDQIKKEPVGAAVSSSANPSVIKLTEGNNVFYIRITAENGSSVIRTLTVANIEKNTESEILSVNGFSLRRNGNELTATSSNDGPQVDIFVSRYATVKVFADRKKTAEVASSMVEYTVTETQEVFTDCRLSAPPSQGYLKLYVDVTSQSGETASYVLNLISGSYSATFNDIEKHWAKKYIEQAYSMGVTEGFANADGSFSFQPQSYATREQIAVFVCNLMGIDTSAYDTGALSIYKDAKSIAGWSKKAVSALTELGIMGGDGTKFNPKNDISRQEFMAVMVRACQLDTSKGKASHTAGFKDNAKISSWAKVYVRTAVAYGLVNGDNKGYINPKNPITRAEIVKIMVCAKDYAR